MVLRRNVNGDFNIADTLTKHVRQDDIARHMKETRQEFVIGKHRNMPEVEGGKFQKDLEVHEEDEAIE